jgi:hypothetical protein
VNGNPLLRALRYGNSFFFLLHYFVYSFKTEQNKAVALSAE